MNKTTRIIILLSLIIAIIIANIAFFLYQQKSLEGDGQPTTYLGAEGEIVYLEMDGSTVSPINPVVVGSSIGAILIALITVVIIAKHNDTKKRNYDKIRQKQLEAIARGLENYYIEHQRYPISETFDPSYYSFLNFTNDWEYYKLPSADIMMQYFEGWPILDPSTSASKAGALNHYLYYPQDNSQSYSLFAHFDTVKITDSNNYNVIDKIPETLGSYNYKLTSPLHPKPELTTMQPLDSQAPALATSTNPTTSIAEPTKGINALFPHSTNIPAAPLAPVKGSQTDATIAAQVTSEVTNTTMSNSSQTAKIATSSPTPVNQLPQQPGSLQPQAASETAPDASIQSTDPNLNS